MINIKLKTSALNCEACNTFSTVGSDHRFTMAKLRLSLRQSKLSTTNKTRCDWSKLLTDNNIKELYTMEVNNRFQALKDLGENVKDSNTVYTNIISAHNLNIILQRSIYQ